MAREICISSAAATLGAHSYVAPASWHRTVDNVEARLTLVKANFKVQASRSIPEQRCTPFNIKNSIGSTAGNGSEDSFVYSANREVAPMGKNCVIKLRQGWANIELSVIRIVTQEL